MHYNRVILIVLDSVGIGELPDAHLYGDNGSNTLGNIALNYPGLHIPNLIQMGIGNIDMTNTLTKSANCTACFGKANEQSKGKDTTTGHWELTGIVLDKPFPTFTDGFPVEFLSNFEKRINTKTIGNISASGTVIINELGQEHIATRYPIVYTSADSVFQIAMHEDIYPIERQYEICKIAREMLHGDLEVGRVIARPFIGTEGSFSRTKRRKDFSTLPPDNLLDAIRSHGKDVMSIGKIIDIFAGKGISTSVKTANNKEGILATQAAIKKNSTGLIFTNLVDFDSLYGHRRDVEGYANCLMEFDKHLPDIVNLLKEDDLLIITADHGNDPTAPGTDHTREYIPILCYGNGLVQGHDFGTRESFTDIAATIAEALEIEFHCIGESFFNSIVGSNMS